MHGMNDLQDMIKEVASTRFGIKFLRPFQQLAITTILEGLEKHGSCQLIVLPTGSGKSICFQLPAIVSNGITVIIYPLLSLMNDQVQSLAGNAIPCAVLRGGQTKFQRGEVWSSLKSGKTKLVITNPETLCQQGILRRLKQLGILSVVIDEAHVLPMWGQSFRPAYLQLSEAVRVLGPKSLTAFTATASEQIIQSLVQMLFAPQVPQIIVGSPDRSNIRYHGRMSICPQHDALTVIGSGAHRPMVIFCPTRAATERMAKTIASTYAAIPTAAYHAGMSHLLREETERWFMASTQGVLCATCAYGMGVSKNDIRTVVHLQEPSSVEAYLQESGRAGRDGDIADAYLLFAPESDTIVSQIFSQHSQCQRKLLLQAMDYPPPQQMGCIGCDCCDKYPFADAQGMGVILKAIGRYPLRYTQVSLAQNLVHSRFLDKTDPFTGILGTWSVDHLQQAIGKLIAIGKIRVVWGRLVRRRRSSGSPRPRARG